MGAVGLARRVAGRGCRAVVALAAALLAVSCAPAMADIWGYIDADGRPHVATERLDDRYQLFYKGRTSADATPATPGAAPDADEAFTRSAVYQRVTRHPNVKRFEPLIVRNAREQGLDVALVKAVVAAESAFEPDAVSSKGALGLMQVIPETAQRYGVAADAKRTVAQKLLDPAVNVNIGTRYLRDLLVLFADDVALALAAYNAGEGVVQRYGNQVPPFPETQEYVKLVLQFRALYRPPPPARPPAARPRLTIPPRTAPSR